MPPAASLYSLCAIYAFQRLRSNLVRPWKLLQDVPVWSGPGLGFTFTCPGFPSSQGFNFSAPVVWSGVEKENRSGFSPLVWVSFSITVCWYFIVYIVFFVGITQ